MSEYVAHFDKESGRIQTVMEHLEGTACFARQFASVFNADSLAYRCGKLHDIGKYSREFQKRILENGYKTDHSTAGAIEAFKTKDIFSAFCIAGHHGGLPDGGNMKTDTHNDATLAGKLKREPGKSLPVYASFLAEVSVPPAELPDYLGKSGFRDALFIRMLYSALVDADFLDTERFMSGGTIQRGNYDSVDTLLERLMLYVERWRDAKTSIEKNRNAVLRACMEAGKKEQGIYKLTVPTGGGKTVASLMFALCHARKHGLRRVIYVIPYTNIIEQTASVFAGIVGEENVLEHHSYVDYEPDENDYDPMAIKKRLATENWDAPIIVTTSVQFFESLFSNKPSRCRKLHNIAGSVVIFDEAQMLPTAYLKPCVAAIYELTAHYKCTAVLCTATQPSLDKLLREYAPDCKTEEIFPGYKELFAEMRRVRYEHAGELSNDALAERLNRHSQVLCIVNRRDEAQAVFEKLKPEGRYHLSTRMVPFDRRRTIQEIKRRLNEGEVCRVVSTSLVEAGVDLDFPTVYRAEAGLDSILQAAGRCNREGKRALEESVVNIYRSEKNAPRLFWQNTAAARAVMRDYPDISSPETVEAYFDLLHSLNGEALDQKRILQAFEQGIDGNFLPFATVANLFKLIETETRTVYIPVERGEEIIRRFRNGERARKLFREAGQFAVEVYPQEFRALYDMGALERLDEHITILTDLNLYNRETGLNVKVEMGDGYFV